MQPARSTYEEKQYVSYVPLIRVEKNSRLGPVGLQTTGVIWLHAQKISGTLISTVSTEIYFNIASQAAELERNTSLNSY